MYMSDTGQITQRVVHVPLGGRRRYDVIIANNALAAAGRWIAPHLGNDRHNVYIISDSNVAKLHLKTLQASLSGYSIQPQHNFIIPAGEGSKSYAQMGHLLDTMVTEGINRESVIIALGGGVVGDLAGFAASILLRGIKYVQIPTTLLAQVDSAVGGKTGINIAGGKNMVGTFYQPRLVLSDTSVLRTLPDREYFAGYAELLKYAMIGDPDLFSFLQSNIVALKSKDEEVLAEAVQIACRMKAEIVARDEHEKGMRALLNFGHTIGHALEAYAGYDGRVLHGEAVAIGMCAAALISAEMKLCGPDVFQQLHRHLREMGLPTRISELPAPFDVDPKEVRRLMKMDKKMKDSKLTFVLLNRLGDAFLSQEVPESVIKKALFKVCG